MPNLIRSHDTKGLDFIDPEVFGRSAIFSEPTPRLLLELRNDTVSRHNLAGHLSDPNLMAGYDPTNNGISYFRSPPIVRSNLFAREIMITLADASHPELGVSHTEREEIGGGHMERTLLFRLGPDNLRPREITMTGVDRTFAADPTKPVGEVLAVWDHTPGLAYTILRSTIPQLRRPIRP